MASRRKTAIGPETQVTEPKVDSAAFMTRNCPSYQTSCMRVSSVAFALRARAWPLTAPSSGWRTSASTHRGRASGARYAVGIGEGQYLAAGHGGRPDQGVLLALVVLHHDQGELELVLQRTAVSSVVPSVEPSSTTMTSRLS